MRILLVDDDEALMEALASSLIEQNYAVDIATDGEMGWEFISLFNYDLVVLDLMLPKMDGISLCRQLRAEGYNMPILLLTARDRSSDKVRGLDAGADDYVVKPFDFEELTARIRALLRRENQDLSPILQWNGLSLDPKTCQVHYQEQPLHLTPKEYAMLELFLRHPQQVFSPGAIIDNIWSLEDPPGEEAVRTHIKGLRQKLKEVGMAKNTIQTIYGLGYRLKSAGAQNNQPDKKSSINVTPQQEKAHKSPNQNGIALVWSQFRDVAYERLAILENLVIALSDNSVSEELQQQARSTAHKLAGSLGGFGFPEGSNIAKQIENLLETELVGETERAREVTQLVESLRTEMHHKPFEETVRATLGKNNLLLIVDNDRSRAQQLATEAQRWGMQAAIAYDLNQARELLQQKSPTAIILKIVFPNGKDLQFLAELHQKMPSLPIVVIIEDANFLDRIEVVRRGSKLVLQHPVTPQKAIASVTQILHHSGSEAKIIIVDDDPQILLTLEIALKPWGFQLTTLDNPRQFWPVLEEVNPDLVLLDVEMPEVSGIELCQVLRADPRWQQLPVLFLTVHQDEKTQHQAFAIGADDYISKPVVGAELASRILNRLERSRVVNQAMN